MTTNTPALEAARQILAAVYKSALGIDGPPEGSQATAICVEIINKCFAPPSDGEVAKLVHLLSTIKHRMDRTAAALMVDAASALTAQQARIAELQDGGEWREKLAEQCGKTLAAEAQVAVLTKALEFYANDKSYRTLKFRPLTTPYGKGESSKLTTGRPDVMEDLGRIAHEALAAAKATALGEK